MCEKSNQSITFDEKGEIMKGRIKTNKTQWMKCRSKEEEGGESKRRERVYDETGLGTKTKGEKHHRSGTRTHTKLRDWLLQVFLKFFASSFLCMSLGLCVVHGVAGWLEVKEESTQKGKTNSVNKTRCD